MAWTHDQMAARAAQEVAARGYDPDFLLHPVVPPELSQAHREDAARLDGEVLIPYTHFSLVQSASRRFAPANPALCVFELIYFARPDSYLEGRNLYEARRRMGIQLAAESAVEADFVMPVPDTGAPAAVGFAEASGLPYREGLVRNRYIGRTFIAPSQAMRHRGVTIKLNPLREVIRGKRLVVVDDSIVRGTTTKAIVALLRRAGAAEVHVRISAPPIHHPCFYGIDTQVETELIAATHSEEGIREFIGADSLAYLSIKGVLGALELPYERFCFACFDGNYPEPVPYDAASRKFVLEESGEAAPAGSGR